MRLQRFIAEAGVASRRAAEGIILAGRVSVNGKTIVKLGTRVDPARDRVTVDSQVLKSRRKIYLALHKPTGLVCSRSDEHGRPTIYSLLPREWAHLHTVGRLDYDTEGLIFLTNDGELSLRLTHPRYGVTKIYLATVEGRVERDLVARLTRGILYQGDKLTAARARLISASNAQSVVELEMTEGKNREVRRLFESQERKVKRLVRMQIGKIKLGEMRPGRWRTLTEPEIKSLLSQDI
jgi:23S rRNA pseudouridine2605 synthase